MRSPISLGPARHRIGHRAVQADAGDHQRQDRKRTAQPGKHDLLVDGLIDVGGLRLEVGDRHARVGLVHDLADRADVAQRVAVGAQRVRSSAALRAELCVRHVHNRWNLALEPPYRAVAATPTISQTSGQSGRRSLM